ncbi:MAG: hypothetical protein ACYC0T_11565 [Ramlibacter sp.]
MAGLSRRRTAPPADCAPPAGGSRQPHDLARQVLQRQHGVDHENWSLASAVRAARSRMSATITPNGLPAAPARAASRRLAAQAGHPVGFGPRPVFRVREGRRMALLERSPRQQCDQRHPACGQRGWYR